jgi:hypothetical protein
MTGCVQTMRLLDLGVKGLRARACRGPCAGSSDGSELSPLNRLVQRVLRWVEATAKKIDSMTVPMLFTANENGLR